MGILYCSSVPPMQASARQLSTQSSSPASVTASTRSVICAMCSARWPNLGKMPKKSTTCYLPIGYQVKLIEVQNVPFGNPLRYTMESMQGMRSDIRCSTCKVAALRESEVSGGSRSSVEVWQRKSIDWSSRCSKAIFPAWSCWS